MDDGRVRSSIGQNPYLSFPCPLLLFGLRRMHGNQLKQIASEQIDDEILSWMMEFWMKNHVVVSDSNRK
jgi:hypothetical protein